MKFSSWFTNSFAAECKTIAGSSTSIDNPGRFSNRRANIGVEPLPQTIMNLVRLEFQDISIITTRNWEWFVSIGYTERLNCLGSRQEVTCEHKCLIETAICEKKCLLLLLKRVYLLCLSRGSNLAGSNGPNWFICQHNVCPVWYFLWKIRHKQKWNRQEVRIPPFQSIA